MLLQVVRPRTADADDVHDGSGQGRSWPNDHYTQRGANGAKQRPPVAGGRRELHADCIRTPVRYVKTGMEAGRSPPFSCLCLRG